MPTEISRPLDIARSGQFFSAIATIWIHFFPHIVSLPYILKMRFPVCFDSSVENSPVLLHVRIHIRTCNRTGQHPLLRTVQVKFHFGRGSAVDMITSLQWTVPYNQLQINRPTACCVIAAQKRIMCMLDWKVVTLRPFSSFVAVTLNDEFRLNAVLKVHAMYF